MNFALGRWKGWSFDGVETEKNNLLLNERLDVFCQRHPYDYVSDRIEKRDHDCGDNIDDSGLMKLSEKFSSIADMMSMTSIIDLLAFKKASNAELHFRSFQTRAHTLHFMKMRELNGINSIMARVELRLCVHLK